MDVRIGLQNLRDARAIGSLAGGLFAIAGALLMVLFPMAYAAAKRYSAVPVSYVNKSATGKT